MDRLDVSVPPAARLFQSAGHTSARVTVAVTLFDYSSVVRDALDSVHAQDLSDIDLVIVDDCSHDGGERVVEAWLKGHATRFGRCALLRHDRNEGLAAARNQGFAAAATPFVFVLDADNQLYPRCLSACVETAGATGADAVYTLLEVFGDSEGVMGTDVWDPARLQSGNYIDAMALIRTDAWRRLGGYRRMPVPGWEDYDLWLKFAEAGLDIVRLPEILCRYRHHDTSMLQRLTNRPQTLAALHRDMQLHHPAVTLGPIDS